MTNLKKKFLWITGALVVLVIFLSTLILLSDRFINQESIINRIQTEMSRVLGGQVEFQRLEFSVFPQVRLVIHQCSFSIPETARGTLASLTIYPKVLPLFTGKLQIAAIDLNAPEIEIRRGKKRAPTDKNLHSFSVGVVQKKVEPVLRFVSSKAPGLILALANGRLKFVEEELVVKAKRFKGTVCRAEDKLTLSLDELKLDYPRLDLSGKFDIRRPSPAASRTIELELKALDVDVASTRHTALALAKDIPVVQAVFKIVKGGRLPHFNFTAHGDTIKALGELDNIAVKGSMRDGEIFVPEVDFDLKDVKGDVTISKGILQAKELEARLGSIFARGGTLKLGLAGENALFHLNLPVEADLAELPSILKHVVGDTALIKELALVENLQGKAAGSIILGEHLASIETNVEIAELNMSASYRRLPYPLKLNSGRFSYKKDIIALKNVSGSMGKSFFSDLSLQFDFKESPHLVVKADQSTLLMDEIYPWLNSFATLKNKLQDLKPVKGTLSLAELSLQGPVLAPEKWRFQTAGDLALEQGINISMDIAVNPDELIINKLVIKDTESHAAAKLDYKNRAFDLSFDGNLNKATLDNLMVKNQILGGWIKGNFHAHVRLDQPVNSTAQGNLQAKDLVVPWKKKTPLVVNNLTLEAQENNLLIESASLSLADDRFDLKGNVNFSADGLNFDMDLAADVLNIDNLKQALGKKEESLDQADQKVRTHPVRGHLKLKTEKFTYEGLTWSPFYGDVAITDKTTTVTVTKAVVCGIATPGTIKISPQEIQIDVKPAAQNQELHATIYCLADKS
ncbi:MAG: hypothetical protein ABIK98_04650, partial [Pseudomonadota bacterium]